MADETDLANYSAPRFRAPKRALVVFFVLVAFSAVVWFERVVLLRGAAELWVVSDIVGRADAVAIFGGGLSVRPFAADEYYRKGLTRKILVSNVSLNKAEMLGVAPSHTNLNRNVLIKLGVPETAIETFGSGLSNTYQEAVALREWAMRTHARSIIVPTENFTSRRVHWVLEHEFAGTGIQIQVPALDDPDYSVSDWWTSEKAITEFQNEVLKYVYYRIKY